MVSGRTDVAQKRSMYETPIKSTPKTVVKITYR